MDILKDLFGFNASDYGGTELETEKFDKISNAELTKEHQSLLKIRQESRPTQEFIQPAVNADAIDMDNSEKITMLDEKVDEITDLKENVEVFIEVNQNAEQIAEIKEITEDISPVKKYTAEEVAQTAAKYFNSEMIGNVWRDKYALKNQQGDFLEQTPEDMHHRIAREFARIEKKYPNPISETEIFGLLDKFQYIIPQGSPMFGIGNNYQIASLSNCFVIGSGNNSDSYGAIMKIDEEQVQLMKRRGGVGHDLSHIRPEGSLVNNSALTSTGIVPFMDRYSNSTREVAQGGRRGALMLSMSVKHPDVEKFIDAKLGKGKVTGANISVKLDDEFMNCVKTGLPYTQQYPIDAKNPTVKKEIDARKLWDKIIHNAWQSAEPGVLFWDTIKKESIPDCYAYLGFETTSTNPCGEIPLCPYDSCRLLAVNLYGYVDNPFMENASFNFEKFESHVKIAQRLMDDLIDLEIEKIDAILQKIDSDPETETIKSVERELWLKIKKKSTQGRRTGLGITAEGDMLAALNIRYGSQEAIDFSTQVHKRHALAAYRSSVELAKERGKFEIYDTKREIQNPFINRLREADPELYQEMQTYGRRNIALLTVAPTGSVSLCSQTTSGLEPVFMAAYTRRRKVNPEDEGVKISYVDESTGDSYEEYHIIHPKFKVWAKLHGYDPNTFDDMKAEELKKIVEQSPYHNAAAHEIDWVMKVKLQGAIQKWVDHSISVTVNLPENVLESTVSEIYKTAHESGCKGMTIYRENSRGAGIMGDQNKDSSKNYFIENHAPKRPERIEADVVRFKNQDEEWIAVVGLYEGRPYEIFTGRADGFYLHPAIKKGWVIRVKPAGAKNARYDFIFKDDYDYEHVIRGLSRMFEKNYWNYAELISGILRHGMPIPSVVNLVSKLHFKEDNIMTWRDGVIRALKKYIKDGTKVKKTCPACEHGELAYIESCVRCIDCGYTVC